MGVEFVLVLEDATRCTPEVLDALFTVAVEVDVRRVTLCDTVGAAAPEDTRALCRWTIERFLALGRTVELEWHGHNDRGLAVVNALTAIESGCRRIHATVLGVGERAGNASLDQLIVNRHLEGEGHDDLRALRRYCEHASRALGVPIPRNYPAMGGDVFTTSAGVHAAALVKAHQKGDQTLEDHAYSSVRASVLGRQQEVLVDASSGASNVRYWLLAHGHPADDALIGDVLEAAKASARPLSPHEIGEIIGTR